MNTENMIEITGADLKEVAKAAYDLSSPQGLAQGLGFLHFQEGGLTDKEADQLIDGGCDNIPLSLDYVKGRACKLTVYKNNDKLYIASQWYDHSEDQLMKLIDRITA